jgi:hypothetical protein
MIIPAFENVNDDPLPNSIPEINDIKGWYHAWSNTEYSWRGFFPDTKPRLYYPASMLYNARGDFVAVDGMGRLISQNMPYSCTINPSSGKFEPLTVQTRDSFCRLNNSTWDRTIMRNAAPNLFRLANFALEGVPLERRLQVSLWTGTDWMSVVIRWIPASLGICILVSSFISTTHAIFLD